MIRIGIAVLCFLTMLTTIKSQSQNNDCTSAQRICKLGKYNYNNVQGDGNLEENLTTSINGRTIKESNSIWLYWDVTEEGEFKFDINPYQDQDDIDFVLYKTESNDCSNLISLRSVMSGANLPSFKNSQPCLGATGLSYKSIDEYEESGCHDGDDNYVSSVNADRSQRFYLLINNYDSEVGFSFELNGNISLDESNCQNSSVSVVYEDMTLYPNPVGNMLTIDIGNSIEKVSDMLILDMTGRVYREVPIISGQREYRLDVSNMPQGMYTMRASGDEAVIEKRFIKV